MRNIIITPKQFIKIILKNKVSVYGFFLDQNKEFIMIIDENDFVIDGYKLIRKKIIKSIVREEYEVFYEKLHKINKTKLPSKKIEMDLGILLSKFAKNGEIVGVENYIYKRMSFDLGIVQEIKKNSCTFVPISALWNYQKAKKLTYKNIDILSWWNRYAITYKKYMDTINS